MKPPSSTRRFDYDRRLLPNPRLVQVDPQHVDPDVERLAQIEPGTPEEHEGLFRAQGVARAKWLRGGEWTMGYPAWNLLYYTMLCSLGPELQDPVVVETGTNRGWSTVVMAQAMKDLGLETTLETVERDGDLVELARGHVREAGLEDYVTFHVGDSIDFLSDLAERVPHIDFILIDDLHEADHVAREIDIVCPKIKPRRGKVYFDNSASWGGVGQALRRLRETHGGSLITFDNCSWLPPGNAIWQPD